MSVRLRVFLEASDRIRRVDIRGDDRGCDGNRWSAHLARDPRDGLRAAPGVAGRIGDLLRRAAARTPPRPRLTPGVRRRLDATVRLVMRDGDVEVDAPDSGAPGSGVGRERERRGLEPVRLQGLPLSPGTLARLSKSVAPSCASWSAISFNDRHIANLPSIPSESASMSISRLTSALPVSCLLVRSLPSFSSLVQRPAWRDSARSRAGP